MRKQTIILIVFLISSLMGFSQKMDTVLRMSIQVGSGWTHYYNDLDIGNNPSHNNFIGYSVRLMWEPEHRLSLGVESGYYKLYTVNLNPGDGEVDLSIIPLMANFKMRILPSFFLTGGTGIVMMNSVITNSSGEKSESNVMSYSNVQASLLYIYKITPQFGVGGELKYIWIDKTDDVFHSLQAVVSYRF